MNHFWFWRVANFSEVWSVIVDLCRNEMTSVFPQLFCFIYVPSKWKLQSYWNEFHFAMLFKYDAAWRIREWPVSDHVLKNFPSTDENTTSQSLESHPNTIISRVAIDTAQWIQKVCVKDMNASTGVSLSIYPNKTYILGNTCIICRFTFAVTVKRNNGTVSTQFGSRFSPHRLNIW